MVFIAISANNDMFLLFCCVSGSFGSAWLTFNLASKRLYAFFVIQVARLLLYAMVSVLLISSFCFLSHFLKELGVVFSNSFRAAMFGAKDLFSDSHNG